MIKYRPAMTPAEEVAFLADLAKLDQAYADMADADAAYWAMVLEYDDPELHGADEDQMAELRRAALDHKGRP